MFCNLGYNLKFLSSDFFTQNVMPFLTTEHKTDNFGKMPGTYACIISSVFKQKPWSYCMPRAITIFLFFQKVIKGLTLYMIFFFYKFIYLFIYLFLAMLGLRFCARAFSSCGKRGPLLIAVRGPLTIAASLVAEHRPQTRRLSSCGLRA